MGNYVNLSVNKSWTETNIINTWKETRAQIRNNGLLLSVYVGYRSGCHTLCWIMIKRTILDNCIPNTFFSSQNVTIVYNKEHIWCSVGRTIRFNFSYWKKNLTGMFASLIRAPLLAIRSVQDYNWYEKLTDQMFFSKFCFVDYLRFDFLLLCI